MSSITSLGLNHLERDLDCCSVLLLLTISQTEKEGCHNQSYPVNTVPLIFEVKGL